MKKLKSSMILNDIYGGSYPAIMENYRNICHKNDEVGATDVSLSAFESFDSDKYYVFLVFDRNPFNVSIISQSDGGAQVFHLDSCAIGQGIKVYLNGTSFAATQVGN